MAVDRTLEVMPWVARWTDVEWDEDMNRPTGEEKDRLVVVYASSPAEARRETGLIDHEFEPAEDDDIAEWEQLESLTPADIEMLSKLLAKEQRRIARNRAKGYAASVGFTTRGLEAHVLTPAGLRELTARGIPARGNDPIVLIDALVAGGIPENDHDPMDHFRARKFAEVRAKLDALWKRSA